jgi:hypothetical protein
MNYKFSSSIRKMTVVLALLATGTTLTGCSLIASLFGLSGTYSFTGASIPEAATTFSVTYIPNNTADLPTLSNALTEGLRDRFVRQTRLNQVPEGGDLAFEGEIISIVEAPEAIGAADGNQDAQATSNRVTVTVQILFTNSIQPEWSFESRQSFDAYSTYPVAGGGRQLPGVDDQIVQEIVDILIENIYNAAVAQW